jgi:hypothetical protein
MDIRIIPRRSVGKLGPPDVAHFGGHVWLSLPPRLMLSGSYPFIPLDLYIEGAQSLYVPVDRKINKELSPYSSLCQLLYAIGVPLLFIYFIYAVHHRDPPAGRGCTTSCARKHSDSFCVIRLPILWQNTYGQPLLSWPNRFVV